MKKQTFALAILFFFSFTIVKAQTVSVNNNVLKFTAIADYETYADGDRPESDLITLANGSSSFTSMFERAAGAEDTLYPDFLRNVLNADHIFEMGSFLIKLDLENDRGLAINSSATNAYSTLLNNDLSASGLFVFSTDDVLVIEVLEKVEANELSTDNFKDWMTEEMQRCRRADKKGDKDANILIWDHVSLDRTLDPCNFDDYGWDNKVVYQKFIFWFSLEAKSKSLGPKCPAANWVFIPGYNAALKLNGNVSYSKRCAAVVTQTQSLSFADTKIDWRPYQSSRSLSYFDFTVQYEIGHLNPTPVVYIQSRVYHIQD